MPFDNAPQRELTADEKAELDVLIKARALIEDPKDWCNHAPNSVSAPYCVMTACFVASPSPYMPAYGRSLGRLNRETPGEYRVNRFDIAGFNDTHTHADVLKLFDLAIRKLEFGI